MRSVGFWFRKILHKVMPLPTFFTAFILKLLLMILLAFFYTRILLLTGYVIATPPFVAGVMLLFNKKRWIWIIAVSNITTVLIYVLF